MDKQTKKEFENLVEIIKENFDAMEGKFDRLEEKMENGFLFVNKELADIKERISKLEKRTIEDSDAQVEEIMKLKKRIDWLEKQFKRIQPAFAH